MPKSPNRYRLHNCEQANILPSFRLSANKNSAKTTVICLYGKRLNNRNNINSHSDCFRHQYHTQAHTHRLVYSQNIRLVCIFSIRSQRHVFTVLFSVAVCFSVALALTRAHHPFPPTIPTCLGHDLFDQVHVRVAYAHPSSVRERSWRNVNKQTRYTRFGRIGRNRIPLWVEKANRYGYQLGRRWL